MDVYKAKIQSDGSLDKIKLRIMVRGDFQNKEMVVDTTKHKERFHQLYFIGALLRAK